MSNISWKAWIPNFITIGRTLFFWLFIFLVAISYQKNETLHLTAFILSGAFYMMDFLDGFAARRLDRQGVKGAMSELGSLLDQGSDKIVSMTMLLYYVTLDIFPPLVIIFLFIATTIIFFRDLLLSSIRLVAKSHNVEFQTSSMGKVRTTFVGFGGAMLYVWFYWGGSNPLVQHVIWGILIAFAAVIALLGFIKPHIRAKWVPLKWDKICIVATTATAAIYPPYTLLLGLIIITMYTLVDYWVRFLGTGRATKSKEDMHPIIESSMIHSTISLTLAAVTMLAVRFTLVGAIAISSAIFMLQLAWSAAKIPKPQAT
jgi:phosphatidylglycerophosphate synthase